jgi:LPXTG-motif cell wall-anchored protein
MTGLGEGHFSYLLFGLALVIIFIAIFVYYFSRKRKKSVEEAKYQMLNDDE